MTAFVSLATDRNLSAQEGLELLSDALVESDKKWLEPLTEKACNACLVVG